MTQDQFIASHRPTITNRPVGVERFLCPRDQEEVKRLHHRVSSRSI
jgi:hypothetical protein